MKIYVWVFGAFLLLFSCKKDSPIDTQSLAIKNAKQAESSLDEKINEAYKIFMAETQKLQAIETAIYPSEDARKQAYAEGEARITAAMENLTKLLEQKGLSLNEFLIQQNQTNSNTPTSATETSPEVKKEMEKVKAYSQKTLELKKEMNANSVENEANPTESQLSKPADREEH